MATLTRLRPPAATTQLNVLLDTVPAPFPVDLFQQQARQQQVEPCPAPQQTSARPTLLEASSLGKDVHILTEGLNSVVETQMCLSREVNDELLSSLSYVQQSCLMTLNKLISVNEEDSYWQPILPNRRHSMPSRVQPENSPIESPSSALHTVLSNLRHRDTTQMSEASSSASDDATLLHEIRRRFQEMAPELIPSDSRLAQTIISFLSHLNRLTSVDPTLSGSHLASVSSTSSLTRSPVDIYDELSRQVMDLQSRRLNQNINNFGSHNAESPQRTVEAALLWSRIDQELETVFDLCLQRNEPAPRPYSPEQLPPEYRDLDTHSLLPPEYEHPSMPYSEEKEKGAALQSASHSEKMKMDFEAVTLAIDRLYMVAPQLHNQRVELKKSKLDELERARMAGPPLKGKEKDVRELDHIISMIGKASRRRLDDQSVALDMEARVARAKEKDIARREAFVEQLVEHSSIRRITSQDAILNPIPTKTRNLDALLTLPEFIREEVPSHLRQELDPDTMLTLPDFIKEELLHEPPVSPPRVIPKKKSQKLKQRSRSYSAPPLAWLLSPRGRPTSPSLAEPSSDTNIPVVSRSMTVRFVAEHHEYLHHLLVFVGVDDGMTPGLDLEAEVLPVAANFASGDTLILRCGQATSTPLKLPVQVLAGKKDVRVQSGHYEIKIPTNAALDAARVSSDSDDTRLLDATELKTMDPLSFICSSCSLVLIQSSGLDGGKLSYHDLPSEYWAELLEAWMCHSDQKLHEHVVQHTSEGLWPKEGQALVGGSYILFHGSAMTKANVRVIKQDDDDWARVQCICGAVVGRRRLVSTKDPVPLAVYRMAKYALRPVSTTSEPCRTPFTAFILEDMMELVHAHASHRFIILDEEEERPRLLIWLFKPKMRLAYATTAQYSLPKTGVVNVAKVLFKIIGPEVSPTADLDSILDKYPGFPQAERLVYPIGICHRIAALLKESNTSYPMGMRVMTGLLVGWLLRS